MLQDNYTENEYNTHQLLTQVFDELPPEPNMIAKPNLSLAIKLTTRFEEMERQLESYTTWLEGEKEKVKRFKQFIKDTLCNFMLAQYDQTKTKTLKLPNGYKLTLRKGQEKVEITNEDELIRWAKSNAPTLLRVEISPNKSNIKKRLKETGELPPGCEITQNGELSFNFSKS